MPLMASPNQNKSEHAGNSSCGRQQTSSSVPVYVQETMLQSGIVNYSEAELKQCAENMTRTTHNTSSKK